MEHILWFDLKRLDDVVFTSFVVWGLRQTIDLFGHSKRSTRMSCTFIECHQTDSVEVIPRMWYCPASFSFIGFQFHK